MSHVLKLVREALHRLQYQIFVSSRLESNLSCMLLGSFLHDNSEQFPGAKEDAKN